MVAAGVPAIVSNSAGTYLCTTLHGVAHLQRTAILIFCPGLSNTLLTKQAAVNEVDRAWALFNISNGAEALLPLRYNSKTGIRC
jgi:pyrrolidone-carboxylate peptidase